LPSEIGIIARGDANNAGIGVRRLDPREHVEAEKSWHVDVEHHANRAPRVERGEKYIAGCIDGGDTN
jgi:hypothetical protein